MAEGNPQPAGELQVAASAGNAAEADLMRQLLAEAGIPAIAQRSIGGPEWGMSGAQYVYVAPAHLARAREILNSSEPPSDEELDELSQQGLRDDEGGEPRS